MCVCVLIWRGWGQGDRDTEIKNYTGESSAEMREAVHFSLIFRKKGEREGVRVCVLCV